MTYEVRVWFTAIGRDPDYSVCVAVHRWRAVAHVHRAIRHFLAGNGANYFVRGRPGREGEET